jgi:3-phenylpropionate/trans-cinnamate dioxygenase ferredoxin reductase component
MPGVEYLIVGGGMTADAAVAGIRKHDARGAITVISAEPDPPYNRPPLSKGLWKGKPLDGIWRNTEKRGAELLLGRTVKSLDLSRKTATDERGREHRFDKLLLATGGTPRRLPVGGDDVIYFRTLADYRRLREQTGKQLRFAVIGGGFIGSEVAAALAMTGEQTALIFPDAAVGARLFPPGTAAGLNRLFRDKGVEVHAGEQVMKIEKRKGRFVIHTSAVGGPGDGAREIVADAVVAGLGITPNVALAEAAGLGVDNGVTVDETLRTSHPDVFAAGDVASFPSAALGRRMRVEHEDNALTMGGAAGEAMAGAPVVYRHLPYFYSDLFEVGYEAVGELDARLEVVEDWSEPHRKGVVYFLHEGRVRGVLLMDVWGKVDAARELIAQPGRLNPGDLVGRIKA